MRRVIICSLHKFPRSGAYSNYIQYFADALASVGYKVELLSGINQEYCNSSEMQFHNIHVTELYYHGNHLLERILNGKLFGYRLKKKLKRLNLTEADLLLFSALEPLIYPIFELKNRYHFKTAGTPLEWFPVDVYKSAVEAEKGERLFRLNEHHDLIFPISHKIAGQFPNNKCLVLPIMADTKEYEYIPKSKVTRYIFIFPANGLMKDALTEMLKGLLLLSDEDLSKMELHLTGVKKSIVQDIISTKEWGRVSECLIIHDWMEYSDLIALYQKSHFLFFARETNQMTESNFPSKVPETMTYGIVPVVSRVGDYTQYYLEDGVNSFIFDGCDSTVCRNMLYRCIKTPFEEYRLLSQNARRCAEEKFDYRKWTKPIKESIEKLFTEKKNEFIE